MRRVTVLVAGSLAFSLVNFRGTLIAALVKNGCRVIASAPDVDPAVIAQLEAMGAEFHRVPMERIGLNPLRDLRTCWSYVRLLRRERPDIVLAYTQKPIVYAGLAARLIGGVRFVAVVTGLGYVFCTPERRGWLQSVTARLFRAALARADRIVAFNADDAEELARRRIVRDAAIVQLVPGSGVDLERFARRPLPPGPPVFLLIARLLADKGICEYAAAAAIVRKAHPQARFQLLGPFDPNPAGIGAEQVERWHRDGVVDYLGATRDVRPYLAGCTVYVLPSYREGVPRTVLEAMAVGRPIITTDAPGCRETVIDGESGFLVPPRDPAALAATMLRFCKEPALARVMAERAHVRARAKFDVEAINARMLDLLLSPQPRDLRAPQSVQLSSGQGADWRRARSG